MGYDRLDRAGGYFVLGAIGVGWAVRRTLVIRMPRRAIKRGVLIR